MRCMITLKDGGAMERAMGLWRSMDTPQGTSPSPPKDIQREWSRWLLEINSAEFKAIHDNVDSGDIVDMKPWQAPEAWLR